VRTLKAALGEMLEKGHAAFQEEYKNAMKRLDHLRDEYAYHFDKVNELKEQLSKYFDTSALKLPKDFAA
jgi:hypothetical protein